MSRTGPVLCARLPLGFQQLLSIWLGHAVWTGFRHWFPFLGLWAVFIKGWRLAWSSHRGLRVVWRLSVGTSSLGRHHVVASGAWPPALLRRAVPIRSPVLRTPPLWRREPLPGGREPTPAPRRSSAASARVGVLPHVGRWPSKLRGIVRRSSELASRPKALVRWLAEMVGSSFKVILFAASIVRVSTEGIVRWSRSKGSTAAAASSERPSPWGASAHPIPAGEWTTTKV